VARAPALVISGQPVVEMGSR